MKEDKKLQATNSESATLRARIGKIYFQEQRDRTNYQKV